MIIYIYITDLIQKKNIYIYVIFYLYTYIYIYYMAISFCRGEGQGVKIPDSKKGVQCWERS